MQSTLSKGKLFDVRKDKCCYNIHFFDINERQLKQNSKKKLKRRALLFTLFLLNYT